MSDTPRTNVLFEYYTSDPKNDGSYVLQLEEEDTATLFKSIEALERELAAITTERNDWRETANSLATKLDAANDRANNAEQAAQQWEALAKQREPDMERLDWLESQATPGLPWIARNSTTQRGYRLHQMYDVVLPHEAQGPTVRAAIDAARKATP